MILFHMELTILLRVALIITEIGYVSVDCFDIAPDLHKWLSTFRPKQIGRHFADDIFKRIFLNENVEISIKISPRFVPRDPINNIPALVQVMACRRSTRRQAINWTNGG